MWQSVFLGNRGTRIGRPGVKLHGGRGWSTKSTAPSVPTDPIGANGTTYCNFFVSPTNAGGTFVVICGPV